MTRITQKQAEALGLEKPSKYRARKTVVDGITFDSKKEATRYAELKILEKGGLISDLELQPEYELQAAYVRGGKKVRAINYRGDFRYKEPDGNTVVEDTKGYRTKEYKLKVKLLLAKYPDIDFRET